MITFDDVLDANRRIADVVQQTPLLTSHALNDLSGNELYFKCENFQRVGAFKIRGAYNKISSLSADQLKRGVVAFSSGNHAQGVALAAKLLNTTAKIVMPNNSPKSKLEATRAYGAQIIMYDFLKESREKIGEKISEEEGRELVPPFNDELIMAGQGTVGLEIFDVIKRLDYVFIPVGGGGLLSGNSISLKYLMSRVKIIGVETEAANDAYQSFRKGAIVTIKPPATIADGMRTTSLGTKTFEVIKAKTDDIILVSDAEVIEAMRWIFSRLKIIVEPTAAVPFAAVLKNELKLKNKRIGIILSGGNIDMDDFFDLLKTKKHD
ncbi:pyridoxal-phosphate dependent enzyme [bacterium]|nr:pyridoxal-phosphate dependent enzyme [bacterium]